MAQAGDFIDEARHEQHVRHRLGVDGLVPKLPDLNPCLRVLIPARLEALLLAGPVTDALEGRGV